LPSRPASFTVAAVSRREETERALRDALLRLLEHRSAEAISVRDIAAEAGVNHGLIHHYFGSKDGLIRAVAEEISAEIYQSYTDAPTATHFYNLLRERPALAAACARLCLDGPHEALQQAAPPREHVEKTVGQVERFGQRLGMPPAFDGWTVNGFFAAAILGWFAFRPLLEAGYLLPDDADERMGRLMNAIDALLGNVVE
jgi:AcrR family transcriptional regulator